MTTVIVGIAGVKYLTQLVSVAEYGKVALGITACMVANQLILGPLANATLRYYAPAAQDNRTPHYLRAAATLVLYATLALAAAGCLAAIALSSRLSAQSILFLALAGMYALVTGWNAILDAVQTAARQRTVVACHQALGTVLRFGIAACAASALSPSAPSIIGGYLLATVATLVSQAYFLVRLHRVALDDARTIKFRHCWRELRVMWHYAWPFCAWGALTCVQLISDRWSLEATRSADDVGQYQVVYQLGYYPMTIITNVIVQFISPILFSWAGDGTDPHRVRAGTRMNWRLTLCTGFITAVLICGAVIFHRRLFFFLTPKYLTSSYLLPYMVAAGGIFACGQVLSLNLLLASATKRLLPPKACCAVAGTALNVFAAQRFGVSGVVYASLLTSSMYCVWLMTLSAEPRLQREVKQPAC